MSENKIKRRTGVIGWPVKHSLSPRLFSYWFREQGIEGEMLPLAVEPDQLEKALRSLAQDGFAGANLTLPHKEAALRIVDDVEDSAHIIGAVNAVTVRDDGSLFGFNTDHFGFIENIRQHAPQWNASDGPCIVLGAGGGARAIIHALSRAGARDIRVINRTLSRAQALAEEFSSSHKDSQISAVNWGRAQEAMQGAGFLVNTTQAGMVGEAALDIDISPLPKEALVSDIVYRPLETGLLQQARANSLRTVDGLGMLLHQGRPGFKAWFGKDVEVSAGLRAHMLEALL